MKIFKEFNAILNYFNCINRFLRLYANFYKKNLLTNAVNCKIILCQTCYSHLNFLYMYNVSSFVKLHRYALLIKMSIDYCVPVNILFS